MVSEKQEISLIIPVRNDNYNGNNIHRLNLFLHSLNDSYLNYKNLDLETILVDWNSEVPINENIFIENSSINLKIIHCTNDLIKNFNYSNTPFNPVLATNVGIRRATKNLIGIINSDAFLKDNFFQNLFDISISSESNHKKIYLIPRKFIPHSVTESNFSYKKLKNYVSENDLFLNFNQRMSTLVSGYGCIITQKKNWYDLCGLNERNKTLGWNDIEFGLKSSKKYHLFDTQNENLYIYDQQQRKKNSINLNKYNYNEENNSEWGLKDLNFKITNFSNSIKPFKENYSNNEYDFESEINFFINLILSKYINFNINYSLFKDYLEIAKVISLKKNIKFLSLNNFNLDFVRMIIAIKNKPLLTFNIFKIKNWEENLVSIFYKLAKENKSSAINIKIGENKDIINTLENNQFLDLAFINNAGVDILKIAEKRKIVLVINKKNDVLKSDIGNIHDLNNFKIYLPKHIKYSKTNSSTKFIFFIIFKIKTIIINKVFKLKKLIKKFLINNLRLLKR